MLRRPLPGTERTDLSALASGRDEMTAVAETADRATSFDYEGLLSCGRGELFGPGNAQLPLPPMLMFDRITSIGEGGGEHGKGHIRAELEVNPDLCSSSAISRGDPVMPGCLGIDALWQMVGFFWVGLACPVEVGRCRWAN